jgi:hypothetical protein
MAKEKFNKIKPIMIEEQFQREFNYQIIMRFVKRMQEEGIIDGKDYKIANEFFLKNTSFR